MAGRTATPQCPSELLAATVPGAVADVVAAIPSAAVLVVPTSAHQRAATVAWARAKGGGIPPLILTMAAFEDEIAAAVVPPDGRRRPLAADEAALVLAAAGDACGVRPAGIGVDARRLARWRADGRTSDHLLEVAEQEALTPRQRRQCRDGWRLWSAYDTLRAAVGDDATDRLTATVDALRQRDRGIRLRLRDRHAAVHDVVVVGQHHCSLLQRQLWSALAGLGWNIVLRWTPTAVLADPDHFATVEHFIHQGWNHEALPPPPPPVVHVRSVATERTEPRTVVAAAKESIVVGGIRPTDIVVVPPRPSSADDVVADLAASAGMPMAGNDHLPLLQVGLVSAVLVAWTVVVGQWKRPDLERLVRCGLVDGMVRNLHDVVTVAASVRYHGGEGPGGWRERLLQRRERLLRSAGRDDDDLARVERALRAVGALSRLLPVAAAPVDGVSFVDDVAMATMLRLHVDGRAERTVATLSAAGRPAADVEAVRTLRETLLRYRTMQQALGLPPRAAADHADAVVGMLAACRVRLPDARVDGIAMATPATVAAMQWDTVFTYGWTDGFFPQFDDDDIGELLDPGYRRRDEERIVRDVVGAARTTCHVLWPRYRNDVDTLPSTWLSVVATLGQASAADDPTGLAVVDGTLETYISTDERRLAGLEPLPAPWAPAQRPLGVVRSALDAAAAAWAQRVEQRPLSPSRLDAVARCPYRFAASYAMGLRTDDADDDALTPLERGAVLHDIVARFHTTLANDRYGPCAVDAPLTERLRRRVDVAAVPMADQRRLLRRLADEALHDADADTTFAEADARVLFGTETHAGLLDRWLARERRLTTIMDHRPTLIEYAITHAVPMPDGSSMEVNLRIDRVDTTLVDGIVHMVVIDYKNSASSIPSDTAILRGHATQMPLYLMAVEADATAQGVGVRVDGAIYLPFGRRLVDGTIATIKAPIIDPAIGQHLSAKPVKATVDERREAAAEGLERTLAMLHADTWPVAPLPSACRGCTYRAICRIDDTGSLRRVDAHRTPTTSSDHPPTLPTS